MNQPDKMPDLMDMETLIFMLERRDTGPAEVALMEEQLYRHFFTDKTFFGIEESFGDILRQAVQNNGTGYGWRWTGAGHWDCITGSDQREGRKYIAAPRFLTDVRAAMTLRPSGWKFSLDEHYRQDLWAARIELPARSGEGACQGYINRNPSLPHAIATVCARAWNYQFQRGWSIPKGV